MLVSGQNGVPESLEHEYKEFRIPLIFDNCVDYKSIYCNDQNLRFRIEETLVEYINKYTAKYTCSFHNTRLNGTLSIGITDQGEIIGVPLLESEVPTIRQQIWSKIVSEIHENIIGGKESLTTLVDLQFIPVEPKDFIFFCYPNVKEFIQDQQNQMDTYIQKEQLFQIRKRSYITVLERYRISLNDILNTPELLHDLRYFTKKLGIYDLIKSEFGKGFYSYANHDIKHLKYDPYSIICWCAIFRDFMTDIALKILRPEWDYSIRPVHPYFQLLREFRPMIPDLVDRGFKIYVIRIKFNFEKIHKLNPDLSYKKNGEIRSPYRTYSDKKEPCCYFNF